MEERKKKIYNKIYRECKSKGMRPEFLSFSKTEGYFKCPLSYKIKYKSGLKIPYKTNIHSDIGSLCHSLIEKYIMYDWDKEKMIAEFMMMAKVIVQKYDKTLDIPIITSLLHFFKNSNFIDDLRNYELEFEKPVYFKVKEDGQKQYWFVGFIDLVMKDKEGNIHIVDFKTSSISSYTGKKLEFNILQLLLYAYVYELHYKVEVKDVSYLFMKFCNIKYLNYEDKKRKKSKLERVHISKELEEKDGKMETLEVEDTLVVQELNKEIKTKGMRDFLLKLFEVLNTKEYDASKRDKYYCEKFCPFRDSEYCDYKDKVEEVLEESSAKLLGDFLIKNLGEANE